MQVMFDAMCDMLMSITDADLLSEIEGKCNDVSNMMLSFPAMIPGTRYYKGIKVNYLYSNIRTPVIFSLPSYLHKQIYCEHC